MTKATANKLLTIVRSLEGMIGEVGAKQKFFQAKIKDCHTQQELDTIKGATVILGSEIDNINLTIEMIDDLSQHLQSQAA